MNEIVFEDGTLFMQQSQLVPGVGGRLGFSGIGARYVALFADEVELCIAIDLDIPGVFRTF